MNDYTTPVPARKGRGCFFYGCLTSVVLLLLAGLLIFLGVRFVRNISTPTRMRNRSRCPRWK